MNLSHTAKLIVKTGVKNLREFGYPDCNPKNIFTDEVYSEFFRSMLKDNRGKGYDRQLNEIEALLPKKEGKQ